MVHFGGVQGPVYWGFKTNHHYWIIIRLNKRGSPLSMSKLQLGVIVKPPNQGCIGDSIDSAVVSFVERLSSSQGFEVY